MKIEICAVVLLSTFCGFASARGDNPAGCSEVQSISVNRLFRDDQEARMKPDFFKASRILLTMTSDRARARIVRAKMECNQLEDPEDFYAAAMILQHGEKEDDILRAHVLSMAAAVQGHEPSRWLSAASLDRYLHRTGKPQVFGTQSRRTGDEPWSKEPYSRWVPDLVREQLRVPTDE